MTMVLQEPVGGGVPPDGSPSARMWFFGEAPGASEERIGKVFVGPAGRHLDMGFRDAGILRSEVFIWNIFQKRPPKNNIGYYFQDKQNRVPTFEGDQMIASIRLMIAEYKPFVIVALGAIPLYILTGETGITKWRGSLLDCVLCPGVKVYPTFHPSYVMRLMQERGEGEMAINVYPTFVRDLQRAKEQSASRNFPAIKRKHIIPETVGEIKTYLKWLRTLDHYITLDIETIGVEGELPIITRVGFAPDYHEGISIPFIKGNKVCWTLHEWAEILVEISLTMLACGITLQNGFFDLTVLGYMWGLRTEKLPKDTMVQQHCAYPHLRKGLDYQVSVYTWQPYYKDERKKHKAGQLSDDALSIYNITDCCETQQIQPITYADIVAMGMREGLDRTISLYPSLLYMMLQGVKVDKERRIEITKVILGKKEEALKELRKYAGGDINPRSPKQLQDLLYMKMGFPGQFNRKTRKLTTDVDALNKLHMKTQHPIFNAIKNFRKYDTLETRYLSMKIGEEGRVHTSYDPTGTVTWRLSSYESHLGGGGNLQNIPKRDEEGREIRKMFVPDEGYIMISADLAQAEDRYVNWKAGDIKGIQDYLDGKDPHWENCKLFFDLPEELLYDKSDSDHYRMRNNLTKHANHANNYDMGPVKFRELLVRADYLEYTLKDCKLLQAKIKRKKPMIEAWKAWVRSQITESRTLVTSLGRKKIFYGRISDDLFRKAYAFDPQSTIGELMSICIRDVHDALYKEGLRILMNVHDEIVCQVPKGTEADFIPKMREVMEIPIQVTDIYGQERELIIPVDFKIGYSWGEMEEIKL